MYNYIAPCIQNLAISCIVYYTYRQYKIRIIRITYCCDTLQNEPGRRKHPHLNRRGTILITMVNITHQAKALSRFLEIRIYKKLKF